MEKSAISNYLQVLTGAFECFGLFGTPIYFYFITNVLIDNGHFCPDFNQTQISLEINSKNIRFCDSKYLADQNSAVEIILYTGLILVNFLSVFSGWVIDRVSYLFVRILIIISYCLAFALQGIVSFDNETWILYLVQILFAVATTLLIVSTLKDLPTVVRKFENEVRSILNSLVIGSGWFHWMAYKLLNHEDRKTNPNYFWSIRNYSFVMLGFVVVFCGLRTFVWPQNPQVISRHSDIKPRNLSVFQTYRRKTVQIEEKAEGHTSLTARVSLLGRKISIATQAIVGYQNPGANKFSRPFRDWKFLSLAYWVIVISLPFYSWIGYQFQWLNQKNFSIEKIDQYFNVTGWFNLAVIIGSIFHGMLVEKLNFKFGFKKTVMIHTVLVNTMIIFSFLFSSLSTEKMGLGVHYFLYFLNSFSTFMLYTNANMCAVLTIPENLVGQGIGFNITLTGAVGFVCILIYLTGWSTKIILLMSSSLATTTFFHLYALYKFEQN